MTGAGFTALSATVGRLPEEFRDRAADLEPYAPAAAVAFRDAAARVEQAMWDAEREPLTLREAARLSGYSADHLSRLIGQGKLRNVGRKHAPLVLRGDLPTRPRASAQPLELAAGAADTMPVDPDMLARARRARGRG
jgi:hypothetical protein